MAIQVAQSMTLIVAIRVFLPPENTGLFGSARDSLVNVLVVLALVYILFKIRSGPSAPYGSATDDRSSAASYGLRLCTGRSGFYAVYQGQHGPAPARALVRDGPAPAQITVLSAIS
ncbi:hypothetical protein ACWD3I_22790 [Streptomyces sp. NPDC002817]